MDCRACLQRLPAWLDGTLPPRLRPALERHLAACPACRAEQAALERAVELLALVESPAPPADLWARVEAGLARPARRRVPALAWALALVIFALVFWPRAPASSPRPVLRDHYRLLAVAPLGSPALNDVLAVVAEEPR